MIPLCFMLIRHRNAFSWFWPMLILPCAAVTLFWSPDALGGADDLVHIAILLSAFCLGASVKDLSMVWRGVAIGLAVSGFIAVAQLCGWEALPQAVKPAGLFMNKNVLGETALVAAVAMFFSRSWWLFILAVATLLLSTSKGAIGAGILVAGLWLLPQRPRVAKPLLCGVIAAVVYAFAAELPSAAVRWAGWSDVLANATLFGNGLGSFEANYPAMQFAHSEPIQMVYELGIFSAPIFALFIYVLRDYGARKPEWFILVAVVAVSLLSFPLHMPLTGFAAALAAGHLAGGRSLVRAWKLGWRGAHRSGAGRASEAGRGVNAGDRFFGFRLPSGAHASNYANRREEGIPLGFRTCDDSSALDKMQFYVPEKIGHKQSITPEGFLLCEDVAIARTGEMLYAHGETPVPVGKDGITRIQRDADEVFKPQFLNSFSGKPVTNDHPPEDVQPHNWRDYTIGITLNPRRGSGAQDDCIVADLLIYDQQGIRDVRSGKRDVSAGYKAQYDELSPGIGKQSNMKANHVALVDSGRCGPRCAIGDRNIVHHQSTGESVMKNTTWKDRISSLRAIFATKDEGKIAAALSEVESAAHAENSVAENELHVHVGGDRTADSALEQRVKGIEETMTGLKKSVEDFITKSTATANVAQAADAAATAELEGHLKEEAPAGVADKAAKATDSMYLSDSFQETVALAEVLVPGIQVPAYDAKSAPKATFDAICGLRRKALELSYATADRAMIDSVNGNRAPDLAGLSCAAARTLFRNAAAVKKASNNSAVQRAEDRQRQEPQKPGMIRSVADLNQFHRTKYGPKLAAKA